MDIHNSIRRGRYSGWNKNSFMILCFVKFVTDLNNTDSSEYIVVYAQSSTLNKGRKFSITPASDLLMGRLFKKAN